MAIVKNQNPGSPFGATYQLNSTADLANLAQFLGKWAELTVLFSWWLQDFDFFNGHGCQLYVWAYFH